MIGSGVFSTNQAMDGTGTVECIPVILKEKPTDVAFYEGGYSVVPYINGLYACYALSFTGGATLKWFRDNFAVFDWQNAEKEGKNIYAVLDSKFKPEPTGILVLPHFAGAATPYMDNDSKAAFVGVTLETTNYDLYKALMEGTSYEMLLNFNTMKALTGKLRKSELQVVEQHLMCGFKSRLIFWLPRLQLFLVKRWVQREQLPWQV